MDDKESKGSLTVSEALSMYEDYKNYWADNYREARIDLKMAVGDRDVQWGSEWDESFKKVKGKPYVVINELPQYIHQVTNDIRQNTPSIKVIPEADGDMETAEIFSGLIRGIEYKSGADEVYDTAAEYAVKCGIGFIGTDHDYCDDDSDEQEMKLKSVPDPLSILIDPASVDCDGRDANGEIALEPISKKDFERLYPGKKFVSFTDPKSTENKEVIILANIFIREFSGNRGKKITVRSYKFSGEEMLAQTTFPGKYVPYVPVYGEVTWIDGKRIVSGLIRQARDPQRRLNHWASKESEILQMAPIAPVTAVEGTLVNERGQWQNPGSEMVLEYRQKDLDDNPAPPPQRLAPPPVPVGIINAMQGAKENIKESMGIYAAGLGKREGDASGKALESLQQEGDVATFHFPDNVRRSVNQVGRVMVEAIPEIYDTPRIIQTVNEETEPKMVGINGAALQEGQKKSYDLTKGKYHVRVTTGASYTTKRQEAAELYGDVIKQNPELLKIIGDLWARNLDVAGAEAMAARFKKIIPPELQDDQQVTDPKVAQLMTVIQQLQAQNQQLAAAAQSNQGEQEAKVLDKQAKILEQQNKEAEIQLKKDELLLKDKELDIKAREVNLKYLPQDDTQQQIIQHSLDEQAADNQLERDLIMNTVSAANAPEPIMGQPGA